MKFRRLLYLSILIIFYAELNSGSVSKLLGFDFSPSKIAELTYRSRLPNYLRDKNQNFFITVDGFSGDVELTGQRYDQISELDRIALLGMFPDTDLSNKGIKTTRLSKAAMSFTNLEFFLNKKVSICSSLWFDIYNKEFLDISIDRLDQDIAYSGDFHKRFGPERNLPAQYLARDSITNHSGSVFHGVRVGAKYHREQKTTRGPLVTIGGELIIPGSFVYSDDLSSEQKRIKVLQDLENIENQNNNNHPLLGPDKEIYKEKLKKALGYTIRDEARKRSDIGFGASASLLGQIWSKERPIISGIADIKTEIYLLSSIASLIQLDVCFEWHATRKLSFGTSSSLSFCDGSFVKNSMIAGFSWVKYQFDVGSAAIDMSFYLGHDDFIKKYSNGALKESFGKKMSAGLLFGVRF